MFREGRANIPSNKLEGRSSTMLDETLLRVHALLKDDRCLTITDMQ